MRKWDCLCEKKGADQLCNNCTADQHLCFRFMDRTVPPLLISKISRFYSLFCDCTDWFVSAQVGNPEDQFSHDAANINCCFKVAIKIPLTFNRIVSIKGFTIDQFLQLSVKVPNQ